MKVLYWQCGPCGWGDPTEVELTVLDLGDLLGGVALFVFVGGLGWSPVRL